MASQTLVGTTPVARVNLLPPEIAEANRARRIQAGLAAAVAGSLVVVGALYLAQVAEVNQAEDDLAAAQQRGVVLQAERAELQRVADINAAVSAKEALIRTALAGDIAWSGYLNDLMLTVPDNVWLTSMTASPSGPATGAGGAVAVPGSPPAIGSVSFAGIAFDHDDVATWLEVLARQRGFSNAYFTSSTETEIGPRTLYSFSSSVTLNDAALSNRVQRLLGN